jgi:hypothetical protein
MLKGLHGDESALSSAAAELGRRGGKKRAENMTPERRRAVARAAAAKRWGKDQSAPMKEAQA